MGFAWIAIWAFIFSTFTPNFHSPHLFPLLCQSDSWRHCHAEKPIYINLWNIKSTIFSPMMTPINIRSSPCVTQVRPDFECKIPQPYVTQLSILLLLYIFIFICSRRAVRIISMFTNRHYELFSPYMLGMIVRFQNIQITNLRKCTHRQNVRRSSIYWDAGKYFTACTQHCGVKYDMIGP